VSAFGRRNTVVLIPLGDDLCWEVRKGKEDTLKSALPYFATLPKSISCFIQQLGPPEQMRLQLICRSHLLNYKPISLRTLVVLLKSYGHHL
jgi:hypothetical protein